MERKCHVLSGWLGLSVTKTSPAEAIRYKATSKGDISMRSQAVALQGPELTWSLLKRIAFETF